MRAAFLFAVLGLSAFYTYVAFADLAFLSMTGRLGPAFFPRIVGVLLIAACLYGLAVELARPGPSRQEAGEARTLLTVIALSAAFVALLEVVGGLLAMILFMLASLFVLNRGRPVQNVAIALLLPGAIYLLFHVWLRASMPEGLIRLPV
jgi:putative tricarboxylic transport membrane protein